MHDYYVREFLNTRRNAYCRTSKWSNLEQAVVLSLKLKKLLYLRPWFVLSLQNAVFWVYMLDSGIVFLLQCALQVQYYRGMFYNWSLWLLCCFNICCISYSSWFSLIWLINTVEIGEKVIWNKVNSSLSKKWQLQKWIRMASFPI